MGATLSGGTNLTAKLKEIREKIEKATSLRVGFLEDSTQPDGTPNAYIAVIQEFGATINMPARTQIIYRKPRRLRKGKKGQWFVKASSKNAVAKEVEVPAHTIVIPARPFFRAMIAQNKDGWGPMLAQMLKGKNFDAEAALEMLGNQMEEQLQASIDAFANPPNAPSTIKKKGFNSPLVDKGNLRRGVGSEVQ